MSLLEVLDICWKDRDYTTIVSIADELYRIANNELYVLVRIMWAYRGLGNHEKALFWVKKALEIDPDHPTLLLYLGDCLLDTGKPEEAIKALEKAYEIISALDNNPIGEAGKLLYFMAQAHYAKGNIEQAKELILQLLQLPQEQQERVSGNVFDFEGLLLKLDFIDEAIAYLREKVDKQPFEIKDIVLLGDAYYLSGEVDRANFFWQRAINQNNHNQRYVRKAKNRLRIYTKKRPRKWQFDK